MSSWPPLPPVIRRDWLDVRSDSHRPSHMDSLKPGASFSERLLAEFKDTYPTLTLGMTVSELEGIMERVRALATERTTDIPDPLRRKLRRKCLFRPILVELLEQRGVVYFS